MILFNSKPIDIKRFPNGEAIITKDTFVGSLINPTVTLKYESDADLFDLLLIRKALWFPCNLDILYLPYSRMDRKSKDYVFTLKTVCKYINWLDFESVRIFEPHSDVTSALLNHCKIVDVTEKLLKKTDYNSDSDAILFPDAGAQKRYESLRSENELVGFKTRDFKTGRIKEQRIFGDCLMNGEELANMRVFIVDDLCSKGGTFMLAAEQLKKMGAREIYVVVAHCEKTIFNGKIPESDVINKVYTTNTILDLQDATEKINITDIALLVQRTE